MSLFLNKWTNDDVDLVPRLQTAAVHCSSREAWVKCRECFLFASVTGREKWINMMKKQHECD